ncbi:6917_t:CDS:2 [Ambispora gerdemannii]|uniref:6917_t:CDS:1 n=1 Tax=Ambispora gerdemannii TaxID=144530 RepID=A0A9N9FCA5_9GLOM|nr:6917_t:CDS:2 [Ambispora gerdemannii]
MAPFSSLLIILFLLTPLITTELTTSHDIIASEKPNPQSTPLTHEITFDVGRTNLAPDGFTRRVWTVNKKFPGQTIHAFKGDRLKVHVINNLGDEETAFHWHGIFQNGTPWYDGVPGGTQCPIPAGEEFTYEFQLPQSGTHWWHSHYFAQYVDGLAGPLIVHDPKDPYLQKYDKEFIVTLHDWYHTETPELLKALMKPLQEGYSEPAPDSGLINGRHSYNCTLAPVGTTCISNHSLSRFVFQQGKKYRIRIINMSADDHFNFSIDEHLLDVIEIDGVLVKSQQVNYLSINAGQRCSVIVKADKTINNFWMRAVMGVDDTENGVNPDIRAIVHYEGASLNKPKTQDWTTKKDKADIVDLEPLTLKPYLNEFSPLPVGTQFILTIDLRPDSNNYTKGFVNNSTFKLDLDHPSLDKAIRNLPIDGPHANLYTFDKPGEVIQVILQNLHDEHHPFHMHGHNFWILGAGKGLFDKNNATLNLIDPIKRDTEDVPGEGWLVIRFVANNPGVWTFHCHLEWHLEQGLSLQFLELPTLLRNYQQPKSVKRLCLLSNSTNTNS